MKNINEYTDKELKILHDQFKELKTYVEKVEFVYFNFGRVNGCINKVETDFDFTIKPKDEEENRVRWMYYFEMKRNETFEKLKSDYESRYEKAPDKARFIEDSLVAIRKIYESNSNLKYGYEMGSLAKNLDFMNWEPIHDIYRQEFLEPYYQGFAYYELERWLIELKDEYSYEEDWVRKDERIGIPVLVHLIMKTGIIDHLYNKYPRLINHKGNLSHLLSILCQVDAKDRTNFLKTLTNALNKSEKYTQHDGKVTSILLDVKAIDPPIESRIDRKK
jgi:hypothetical protein